MTTGLELVKVQRKKRRWPMIWYKLFFMPSERETEKARKKIKKSMITSRSETALFAISFSEGKVKKGDRVKIKENEYIFLGASPEAVILEMFLFFDEKEQEFFRLSYSFDGITPI